MATTGPSPCPRLCHTCAPPAPSFPAHRSSLPGPPPRASVAPRDSGRARKTSGVAKHNHCSQRCVCEGCKTSFLLLNKKELVNSCPRSKGRLRTNEEDKTIIPLYIEQHELSSEGRRVRSTPCVCTKVFIRQGRGREEVRRWRPALLSWRFPITIIYNNRGKEGSGAITQGVSAGSFPPTRYNNMPFFGLLPTLRLKQDYNQFSEWLTQELTSRP